MAGCQSPISSCKFEKLNDFRERDLFTDVTFVVEGANLRAHKNVLSARSEVFQLMFTTPMTEAIHNVVNITDVSKEAFKTFIEFLYTNCAVYEVVEKQYAELLYLADKYLVAPLTTRCVEHLIGHLGSRSIVEMLSLAESFKIPELKKKVISYLSYDGEEFLGSKDFEKLIANFRFSEMVVSGIKPTTVSKTLSITPDSWFDDNFEKDIKIRNNGNIVTVRVELRHRRKTLYGYLELMDDYYWNRPVEMTFKFSVSRTDGSLMHSGQGDVWWESRFESDEEWECRSQPERRRALFEYCHQSRVAIKNMDFVFSITLSQWVTPNRVFKKRRFSKTDHKESEEVGVSPPKVLVFQKVPGLRGLVQTTQFESSYQISVLLENEMNCDGLDATTLQTLRQHISSDLLPEESEVNASLIRGAHKFSLTELVEYCEKVIASKVDAENVVELLILARQLALKKLECTAVDFIDLHQLEVVASKGWPQLKYYPELVATILKKLITKPHPFEPLSKESHPRIILPPNRGSDSNTSFEESSSEESVEDMFFENIVPNNE